MKLRILILACAAGCSSPPEPAPPAELAFASSYLQVDAEPAVPEEPPVPRAVAPVHPIRGKPHEIRGVLEIDNERGSELARVASDDAELTRLLEQPVTSADLEALAWLRSPEVRAARERVEATRTGYDQATDLRDLVALYRSFVRSTVTRVGPEMSRRATATIAPAPNVDALSGRMVDIAVDIAFEELRRVVVRVVTDAERAHADAVRLAAARRVLREDVTLHEALMRVLRARVESGRSPQTALLAFQSRLESLRTELKVLDDQQAATLARWNRLLRRAPDAAANLDLAPASPDPAATLPPVEEILLRAEEESPKLRIASLRVERQTVAVRLAETMTLPRMDVGSSRFERERAGEAGVQRGPVFPEPGRMVRPRWDFGVRESQLGEMRARLRAAMHARVAARDATTSDARVARFELNAAQRRWQVHRDELVPLAKRAYETARGSYEGNEIGYLELLESARELLRARLGLVDARRAASHARARLLRAVGVRTHGTGDGR